MMSLALAALRFLLIAWQVDTLWLLLFAQNTARRHFGSSMRSGGDGASLFSRRHQSKGRLCLQCELRRGRHAGGLLSGPCGCTGRECDVLL